jgi:Ca2+-binding EF-hand superfamily protein
VNVDVSDIAKYLTDAERMAVSRPAQKKLTVQFVFFKDDLKIDESATKEVEVLSGDSVYSKLAELAPYDSATAESPEGKGKIEEAVLWKKDAPLEIYDQESVAKVIDTGTFNANEIVGGSVLAVRQVEKHKEDVEEIKKRREDAQYRITEDEFVMAISFEVTLVDLFDTMDTSSSDGGDGADGVIDKKELEEKMKSSKSLRAFAKTTNMFSRKVLEESSPQDLAKMMFTELDADGDGKVTLLEFLSVARVARDAARLEAMFPLESISGDHYGSGDYYTLLQETDAPEPKPEPLPEDATLEARQQARQEEKKRDQRRIERNKWMAWMEENDLNPDVIKRLTDEAKAKTDGLSYVDKKNRPAWWRQ